MKLRVNYSDQCRLIMMRGSSRGKNCPNSQRLIRVLIILGILTLGVSAGAGRFLTLSDNKQGYEYVPLPIASDPYEPWQAGNPEKGHLMAFTGMQRFFDSNINGVFFQISHFAVIPKVVRQQTCQLLDLPPPAA